MPGKIYMKLNKEALSRTKCSSYASLHPNEPRAALLLLVYRNPEKKSSFSFLQQTKSGS